MSDVTLIDISVPYAASIPPWPGDTPFSCGWTARREDGASINLAALTLSAHSGTHADAPLHVESGWPGSEALPVAVFVGEVAVIALDESLDVHGAPHPQDDAQGIDIPTIARLLGARLTPRVLLRTGRSVAQGAFPEQWPVLGAETARWLIDRGVRLFGTDAPSVDARESSTLPVHHVLFAGGAFVLENLALAHVAVGTYELLAQPLLVHGADAAPVRAMLRPMAG